MKKIIINADDYGLTIGCSQGIIKAMQQGIITSTTVMINMPEAMASIDLLKANKITHIGLHLNLTYGKPLSTPDKVLSLIDERGYFKRLDGILSEGNLDEINYELSLQVAAFLKTGLTLTHIDSHHHMHMRPKLQKLCVEIARGLNVPIRKITNPLEKYDILTTDEFYASFYKDSLSIETIKNIIENAPEGISEIMTHPGYVDETLMMTTSYNTHRQIELDILTNPDLIAWINKKGIKLVNYQVLKEGLV